ncbi:hypothetical protein B0O99DRAFT_597117 [Bisporella sp. PMI_857]|nr:hypothetical protein B0O99DRAFT_597117 [Bisporella sp. PMI_857]
MPGKIASDRITDEHALQKLLQNRAVTDWPIFIIIHLGRPDHQDFRDDRLRMGQRLRSSHDKEKHYVHPGLLEELFLRFNFLPEFFLRLQARRNAFEQSYGDVQSRPGRRGPSKLSFTIHWGNLIPSRDTPQRFSSRRANFHWSDGNEAGIWAFISDAQEELEMAKELARHLGPSRDDFFGGIFFACILSNLGYRQNLVHLNDRLQELILSHGSSAELYYISQIQDVLRSVKRNLHSNIATLEALRGLASGRTSGSHERPEKSSSAIQESLVMLQSTMVKANSLQSDLKDWARLKKLKLSESPEMRVIGW